MREALQRALRATPQGDGSLAGTPDRTGQVDDRTRGALGQVAVVRTGCLGLCSAGPAVVTYPEGDVHLRVQPSDTAELAQQLAGHIERGQRQVKAPPWFREQLVSRLGYYVSWLRRKASAQSG